MGLAVLDIILALLSKIGRITEFFYPKFSMMVLLQWIGYYSHCPISRFVFCLTHIQLAWHWVLHDYVHIPAYYDCSIERRTIEHHSVASKRSSDYKRCTTWLFKIRMTSWSDKIHPSIVSTMLAQISNSACNNTMCGSATGSHGGVHKDLHLLLVSK
jgi:hypothetical protein